MPNLTAYNAVSQGLIYWRREIGSTAVTDTLCWDAGRVWIYTQDRPFTGKRIYAPVRNPDYNESNYRTTVSLPAWKEYPGR